jgi:hypothetical protein
MTKPYISRLPIRIPGLLVFAALALVACNGDTDSRPHGRATLTFEQSSPSSLVFELKNGTFRRIWFDGVFEPEMAVRPLASGVDVECKPEGSEGWIKQAPVLAVYSNGEHIGVAPGESRKLVVGRDFVDQFKNGVCRIQLLVAGGLILASDDFTAP